jgi:hypothetical protein
VKTEVIGKAGHACSFYFDTSTKVIKIGFHAMLRRRAFDLHFYVPPVLACLYPVDLHVGDSVFLGKSF